jgi:putative membrane-bound dehydrogenase-like protein
LVTYASSVTGSPLRTFARKKRFTDEDELMGVKSYGSGYGDYTVTRADHWMFEGTGMKNGDSIVGLIGWEFHGTPNTRIPGLVEVARAKLGPRSVRPGRDADGWHSSVIYPGPKGNWVFNAGTIWWPEGLASPPGHAPAGSQIARSSGPDERVQRITKNLLQRMLRRFSNPILMKSHYWIAAIAAIALGACGGARTGPPWPVEESIARMRIEPSYTISPFAKEPDVVAPVAMDWDENGRIYVVENPGYPLNVEGRVGRVKILEDTNGDGLPDKAAVFADQLVLPTGVMRWKQGILVTDAPDVWYLEDSNGDGRADRKRKVLTGFAFTNPQHTVNSPLYGLDNWIHLAHENPTTAIIFADKFGDRGSDIRFADKPEAPVVKERGRNIRFRPDTFEIEALSGTSQFGHSFDDWGHHFTLNNTYHARHEVIAARYLKRNPDLVLPTAQEDLPDYGRPARVFPIAPRPRLEMLTNTGEFTSACGLVYFRENLFVAEPAHNLAHRAVLARNGPTFVARRPLADTEFIASTDPWFRPVNFYVGPDGVLYLLDYYRLVIEHPEWMSERNSQAKDLSAGADRGRIYRIRHRDWNTSGPRPASLGTAQVEELVAYLTHPNVWWRRNAQRLLVDRKPPDAASLLRRLFELTPSAPGRVHALWSLEGLGQLDDAVIEKALQDPVAGVKENAIRLAESRPALAPRLVKLVDDPDPRVRFQLLASLGSVDTAAARAVRDRLLERDIEDRWMQAAALSASPAEAGRLFARSGRWATKETKGKAALFRTIGSVIGTRLQAEEVESVLARLTRRGTAQLESAWWRAATLEGMATGMKSRIASPRSQELLVRLFSAEHAEIRRASLRLLETLGLPASARPVVARAEMVAKDSAANPERRADSVGLLAIADAKQHRVVFEELVDPRQPEAVQIAAVRGLGRVPGTETAAFLIGRWRALTTSVRLEAADALYRDPSRIPEVVAAVKSGDIQPWTLAFRHRRQLIMHRDRAIRDAARPLLEPSAGERGQVLDKYRAALERTGNAARGKSVFGKVCAKCHRLDGEGAEVGPDLATVRHQPKQVLLEDILDPNRAISQGFEAYVAETVSGATLDGVLGTQTATSITLRREEGKQDTVARKDIRKIYATNLSAMPGDLEKQVSVEQMADLLEYLKRPR